MTSFNIPTYSQYGNILVPSKDLALARGSGNFNDPPLKTQSTSSGPSQKNSFPMYVEKTQELPEPMEMWNTSAADYTVASRNDDFRDKMYVVGSTGFHSENSETWQTNNQYLEWALKSLIPGGIMQTPLIEYFFSVDNVEYLQNKTIQETKRITGETIDKQNVDDLLIIMRNKLIYAYSGWLPHEGDPNKIHNRGESNCSLETRLGRLNTAVLQELVKQILSGLNSYKEYYKQASSLPMPLERSTYVGMSGSRTLLESLGFDSGHEKTLAANSFNMRYNIL